MFQCYHHRGIIMCYWLVKLQILTHLPEGNCTKSDSSTSGKLHTPLPPPQKSLHVLWITSKIHNLHNTHSMMFNWGADSFHLLLYDCKILLSDLIVLSELPLTTSRSLYCRHAIPRLCPFRVLTNSHVEVFHTLMVRSPEAETIYFSSKSTTFTAARCPTSTRRNVISVCDVISHTAIDRSCNIWLC